MRAGKPATKLFPVKLCRFTRHQRSNFIMWRVPELDVTLWQSLENMYNGKHFLVSRSIFPPKWYALCASSTLMVRLSSRTPIILSIAFSAPYGFEIMLSNTARLTSDVVSRLSSDRPSHDSRTLCTVMYSRPRDRVRSIKHSSNRRQNRSQTKVSIMQTAKQTYVNMSCHVLPKYEHTAIFHTMLNCLKPHG